MESGTLLDDERLLEVHPIPQCPNVLHLNLDHIAMLKKCLRLTKRPNTRCRTCHHRRARRDRGACHSELARDQCLCRKPLRVSCSPWLIWLRIVSGENIISFTKSAVWRTSPLTLVM